MNRGAFSSPFVRVPYRVLLSARRLRPAPTCSAFGPDNDQLVERIHVINLDRHDRRWRQMRRELAGVRDGSDDRLLRIARRFSAIDARYCTHAPDDELLHEYALAEQLFVDPEPRLDDRPDAHALAIEMSRQEAAVARSHIAVWRLIAQGAPGYSLVLEDDVYFGHRFSKAFERAWRELEHRDGPAFDVLYLSYKEARDGADMTPISSQLVRPSRGLWQLSGYVLSKRGAERMLALLPVRGPVDLWINHQFDKLEVLATRRPAVRQRLDNQSSNSYSVLPILSKVGVLTRERPETVRLSPLPAPVIGFGDGRTGLTSLATALSMLGYKCCSDVTGLPATEHHRLVSRSQGRVFDAYVNVGSLEPPDLVELASTYPGARFIFVTDADTTSSPRETRAASELHSDAGPLNGEAQAARPLLSALRQHSANLLTLPTNHKDKWQMLTRFLDSDYPSHRYPECDDQGQRAVSAHADEADVALPRAVRMTWDKSPWIADGNEFRGVPIQAPATSRSDEATPCVIDRLETVDNTRWLLRDDTFPSNLALFSPANFRLIESGARLTLRKEPNAVRNYTSASISSRCDYLYGHFAAELRPARVSGTITGLFLHRNSPRQEIDMEFLGKDTTKLLINVYFNPGAAGSRLEYGYRGTPVLLDLGFDAADDVHRYEIEWTPAAIRWRVDGQLVHQRVPWNPTPIPHLPMALHVNLWHTRSRALAGKLNPADLPASTDLQQIDVTAWPQNAPERAHEIPGQSGGS